MGEDITKSVVLAIALLGAVVVHANAMSLREAVREGYEVKTASGFWVILQGESPLSFTILRMEPRTFLAPLSNSRIGEEASSVFGATFSTERFRRRTGEGDARGETHAAPRALPLRDGERPIRWAPILIRTGAHTN